MSICKSNKGVDGVVSVTICSSGMRSWECIGFIEDLDGINVLVDVALRHQHADAFTQGRGSYRQLKLNSDATRCRRTQVM